MSSPTNDRTHGTGACCEYLLTAPEAARSQGLLPVGMATSHCSVGAAVDAVVVMVARARVRGCRSSTRPRDLTSISPPRSFFSFRENAPIRISPSRFFPRHPNRVAIRINHHENRKLLITMAREDVFDLVEFESGWLTL